MRFGWRILKFLYWLFRPRAPRVQRADFLVRRKRTVTTPEIEDDIPTFPHSPARMRRWDEQGPWPPQGVKLVRVPQGKRISTYVADFSGLSYTARARHLDEPPERWVFLEEGSGAVLYAAEEK